MKKLHFSNPGGPCGDLFTEPSFQISFKSTRRFNRRDRNEEVIMRFCTYANVQKRIKINFAGTVQMEGEGRTEPESTAPVGLSYFKDREILERDKARATGNTFGPSYI